MLFDRPPHENQPDKDKSGNTGNSNHAAPWLDGPYIPFKPFFHDNQSREQGEQDSLPSFSEPEDELQGCFWNTPLDDGLKDASEAKIAPEDEPVAAIETEAAALSDSVSGSPTESAEIPPDGVAQPNLGRRIVSMIGTLLIVASIIIVLSPVWIKYWDRYNPFSTVQEKPVLPVIDLSAADGVDFPLPLPIGSAGILEIPALALRAEVAYGIDSVTLENGPGFYPQSGVPGSGNVSIAGHRNTAGSPFRHLDDLVKGDIINLYYENSLYTYKVDSVFITDDRDWSVIDPTPVPAITLTTCDPVIRPLDGQYDRLIVRAYLEESN